MYAGWIGKSMGGVALAVLLCASVPAAAGPKSAAKRSAAGHSVAAGRAAAGSIGSFTPAAADPRAAALLARSGLSSGFRFTPAATPGGRRAVTVAVRAARSNPGRLASAVALRSALPQVTTESVSPVTPTAYSLGAAVGWKRFALSGDMTRIDTGALPGGRELVDLGLSYSAKRWTTRLQLGADHSAKDEPNLIGRDESYSIDVAGSYSLTRNLDVTGGLRYKTQRDWLQQLEDQRRDSQAVYLGTAFRF